MQNYPFTDMDISYHLDLTPLNDKIILSEEYDNLWVCGIESWKLGSYKKPKMLSVCEIIIKENESVRIKPHSGELSYELNRKDRNVHLLVERGDDVLSELVETLCAYALGPNSALVFSNGVVKYEIKPGEEEMDRGLVKLWQTPGKQENVTAESLENRLLVLPALWGEEGHLILGSSGSFKVVHRYRDGKRERKSYVCLPNPAQII